MPDKLVTFMSSLNDFFPWGINFLTGERCGMGIRKLYDLDEQGIAFIEQFLGGVELERGNAWNSNDPQHASIMLPQSTYWELAPYLLFTQPEIQLVTVRRDHVGVHGYTEENFSAGLDFARKGEVAQRLYVRVQQPQGTGLNELDPKTSTLGLWDNPRRTYPDEHVVREFFGNALVVPNGPAGLGHLYLSRHTAPYFTAFEQLYFGRNPCVLVVEHNGGIEVNPRVERSLDVWKDGPLMTAYRSATTVIMAMEGTGRNRHINRHEMSGRE